MNQGKKKRYRIYRNLNNGKLSIKYKNLVVGHCDSIRLHDVKFIVGKSASARVKRTGERNVHAFVEGCINLVTGFCSYKDRDIQMEYGACEFIKDVKTVESTMIRYNPHFDCDFYSEDGIILDKIKQTYISNTGTITGHYYLNDKEEII